MLIKFEVENFKNFKKRVFLDFTAKDYTYNDEVVKERYVNKALMYGTNGSGKSNFGFAIMDIIDHLTDNEKFSESNNRIEPYINMDSGKEIAHFKYVFDFDGDNVIYEYGKSARNKLKYEKLYFNSKNVLEVDYSDLNRIIYDKEIIVNLNMSFSDNKISVVKYVANNSKTGEIKLLSKMIDFVKGMLWYRFLTTGRTFAGYKPSEYSLDEALFNSNRVEEFKSFLLENEIDMNLEFIEQNGKHVLMSRYRSGLAEFGKVSSTGTSALYLFFIWMILAMEKKELTFLFMDEFDAFLHFESSAFVVKKINKMNWFQTIFTTHNTSLMSNSITRPDCCFIVNSNGITPLHIAVGDKELRQAHNLEKIYRSGGFYDIP